MSEILAVIFPLEIINNIILFFSEKALQTFYDGIFKDPLLQSLVLYRKYRKVKVDCLEQLVEAASFNAPIGTMYLNWKDEYLRFFKVNPSFLSRISDVKLVADCQKAFMILREVMFRKISHFEFKQTKVFDPSLISRDLKLISISFSNFPRPRILNRWPPSLTCLKISGHSNLTLIELPMGLRELSCCNLDLSWNLFPSKLETISLSSISKFASNQVVFPEGLKELKIAYFPDLDIEEFGTRLPRWLKKFTLEFSIGNRISYLKFPDSLEVLDLSCCDISSIKGSIFPMSLVELYLVSNKIEELLKLKFPETLRVLNLNDNCIGTFDHAEFPNLLRELYASGNQLTSLDRASFPDLELLDISVESRLNIKSIRNVKFPSTLKILRARGHSIRDCRRTSFPEGLKELEITVKGKSQRLSFPPELEFLDLTLPESWKSKLSYLELPATLQDLRIENGSCIEFDWKLPLLQKMTLSSIKGRVKVPLSVSRLSLFVRRGEDLKSLVLSQKLDEFQISCHFGHFYDEVITIMRHQQGKEHGWRRRLMLSF